MDQLLASSKVTMLQVALEPGLVQTTRTPLKVGHWLEKLYFRSKICFVPKGHMENVFS